MFYIAFENSICDEYVTEKFFRTVQYPIVPIVMGDSVNYKRLAPPKSYIDVNDFESVEKLANYLKKLMNNPQEYLEYFKWKNDYYIYTFQTHCQLCEKLNSVTKFQVVENAYEWWYQRANGESTCSDGSDRSYFDDL